MSGDGFPERESDPRDDRTGWERPRDIERCACGRMAMLRGQCVYGLHGLLVDEHPDGAA